MSYKFTLAKKGFGLLGKGKKSTDTIKIKPSGKKTETEKYLKNRKKPTTYKDDFKDLKKFMGEVKQDFDKSKLENIKIVTKKNRSKKKPDKVEKAFKNMKNYFKEVEKTPEMKAYRKKENWPKPGKK